MKRFQFVRQAVVGVFVLLGAWGIAADDQTSAPAAQRIVSLNGSNTELLFALGLGDQVVARDDSAIYPPEVTKLPSIGYKYKLSAEGILAARPTLVVGQTDVKPPAVVEQIRAAGVPVELIKEPSSIEEAEQRISKLAAIVGKEEAGKKLLEGLRSDLKTFEARKAELGDKVEKRVLFLYFRGPKTMFVLGESTPPGAMLKLVGAKNVAGSTREMAPINAEALVAADPEVIVVFTHGLESIGGIAGINRVGGVAETTAGRNKRFVVMDDLYLGGMTNRAGKAALDLLNALQDEGVTEVKNQ